MSGFDAKMVVIPFGLMLAQGCNASPEIADGPRITETTSSETQSTQAGQSPKPDRCIPKLCYESNAQAQLSDDDVVDGVETGFLLTIPEAYRWVSRVEVKTGLISAENSLSLKTSTPSGFPASVMATRSFSVSPEIGWQGVTFEEPVRVTPGERPWLIWGHPANSGQQASQSEGGELFAVIYRTGLDLRWVASSAYFKARVYCCEPS